MNDNKLYALFWKLVATVLVVTVVSCSTLNSVNTTKINDTVGRMVTEGVSPKKAGCAVAIANGSGTDTLRMYCAIPE